MPGKSISPKSYRYGFNGKERDTEWGGGATYDYGFRVYDGRIGKFLSVDPLAREYSWNSSYAYAENQVIWAIDLDGLERLIIHAQALNKVGNTKIDVEGSDVLAYKVSFSIEEPDGKIRQVELKGGDVIMVEAKSQQEGMGPGSMYVNGGEMVNKEPNAFTGDVEYELFWIVYHNKESLYPKGQKYGLSKHVVIHPSGGTDYLVGCKTLCFEPDFRLTDNGHAELGSSNDYYENMPNSEEVFRQIKSIYDENNVKSMSLIVNKNAVDSEQKTSETGNTDNLILDQDSQEIEIDIETDDSWWNY